MNSEDTRRASLAELRKKADQGEIRSGDAEPQDDLLPPEFWDRAELVQPAKTSVHLKLDPEVFAFFKQGGKGHLTRMQNVLTAFAKAKQGRSR